MSADTVHVERRRRQAVLERCPEMVRNHAGCQERTGEQVAACLGSASITFFDSPGLFAPFANVVPQRVCSGKSLAASERRQGNNEKANRYTRSYFPSITPLD